MSNPRGTQPVADRMRSDPASRRAVGWSTVALVVACAVWLYVCAGSGMLLQFVSIPLLSLVSAVGAIAFAVPYLVVILWLDRNEKEPLYLTLSTLAWGALVATLLSLVVGGVAEGLAGPVAEELAKGAALMALYLLFRSELDNVLDGVVYGALIGLAFAAFENFIYYLETGQVGTALALICVRGLITAPGSHACFTAITGVGVGLFRVQQGPSRWVFPPLALGVSVLAHLGWNSLYQNVAGAFSSDLSSFVLGLPFAVIGLQLPFIVLVAAVTIIALKHETGLIERFLHDETPPVMHGLELSYLIPARRRSLRSSLLVLQGRFADYKLVRDRNERLVQLAFEKWHLEREGDDEVAQDHTHRIEELRTELTALPPPPT